MTDLRSSFFLSFNRSSQSFCNSSPADSSFISGSFRCCPFTVLLLVRSQSARYFLPARVPPGITRPTIVHTARFQENGSISARIARQTPVHVNISEILEIFEKSVRLLFLFPWTAFILYPFSATDLIFWGCSLCGCLLSSACRFLLPVVPVPDVSPVALRFSSRRRISRTVDQHLLFQTGTFPHHALHRLF